jgi:hypothetical protein
LAWTTRWIPGRQRGPSNKQDEGDRAENDSCRAWHLCDRPRSEVDRDARGAI